LKNIYLLLFILVINIFADNTAFELNISKFSDPVKIDGVLEEVCWKDAAKIKKFYGFQPIDGEPAVEQTAVLLGFSENSFYAAFICFDPIPGNIRSSITKRDEIFDDDFIILYLDTFNDSKTAYQFAINPHGIQADGIYIEAVGEDFNPDFIFYSEGKRFKKGYILEVEIPFKSLRFPEKDDMSWGIAILRRINHLDKDIIWPRISRNLSTFIPQFGKIHHLRNISAGNNIELLPEITASRQDFLFDDNLDEGSIKYEAGINLKYGLTSNLTFDLTYNPDFSQIESDADKIDVNRRYPLKYDEKRPFFLEGTNIFRTPIEAVYTRKLVNPLVGFKTTGQIGDYSIGVLGGIDEYYGSKQYLDDLAYYQSLYDPCFNTNEFMKKYLYENSYHGIVRLQKNIWDYSNIGILATDKEFGKLYSRTLGLDGRFIYDNEYIFTFQALQSQSKNFFETEEKQDPAFYAELYRRTRSFSFQLFYNDIYPNFEAENGFLERTDFRQFGTFAWYDIQSDKSFFRLVRPNFYAYQMHNHDNIKIEQFIAPSLTIQTSGQTKMIMSYYRMMEEYNGFNFNKNQFYFSLNNKTFPWLFVDFEALFGDGIYYYSVYEGIEPFLGNVNSISTSLLFKPTSQWINEISVNNYFFDGSYKSQKYQIIQDIYRFKTTYQFTRSLFLRIIIENNNYYDDLDLNILLSYQFIPGTLIFLGYNDYFIDFDPNYAFNIFDVKPTRFSRGFFSKFSYLFRF
jgi:hypothetical protein